LAELQKIFSTSNRDIDVLTAFINVYYYFSYV